MNKEAQILQKVRLAINKNMKKYILLVSIIFTSCSTIKIEEKIVEDFIKEKKIEEIPYKNTSYLIKEASSSEKVLDYYKIAYLDKNLPINHKRIEFIPHSFNDWPIDIEQVKSLEIINKKDNLSYYWDIRNFKSLNIPIIDRKDLLSKINNETISISATGHVISKPILSFNKKYALLKYSSIFFTGGTSERVYLMEKINDKWIIKLELSDPNIVN